MLRRMIERSRRYLYYVVDQVDRRKMPLEIALLPMIESAYNPAAYSRAHASGMWQFIPSTGRDYGLRQSWWYDGRRDVIEATEAALDYLEKLHGMFGDWQLALAAYNWGEGSVGRAIERNAVKALPTDYESLSMPDETRNYLPKLVAIKNIVSDPARYGLTIADIPNEPYFAVIRVTRHMDVELAAELANTPLKDFRLLNPGHKKPVIRAGETEQIVVPKTRLQTFHENLKRYTKALVSWKAIRLRRSDKVHLVAAAHGMSLAELKEVNDLTGRVRLQPGQTLLVRVKGGLEDPVLPEITPAPVSLPRAVQSARENARNRAAAPTRHRADRGPRRVERARATTRSRARATISRTAHTMAAKAKPRAAPGRR
jgi:membrane-bound lytic murein transglycosylase D